MELETAARRYLMSVPEVAGYIGPRAYKFSLLERLESTSRVALVVRRNNGWAQPDPVKSSEFPLLAVECWADPTRDATGVKTADDAIDKAYALHRAVDRALHGLRDVWWGAGGTDPGLRVLSCSRWSEPYHLAQGDIPAGQGLSGVYLGECVVVIGQWAVHTTH